MKDNWLQVIGRTLFRRPFCTAFMFGVILSGLFWLSPLAPALDTPNAGEYFVANSFLLVVFWWIFGLFGMLIQDIFITYISGDNFSYGGFRDNYLLLKIFGGKVIDVGKCFWGKSGIIRIAIPPRHFYYSDGRRIEGFQTRTCIERRAGASCKVNIPVLITVVTDGDYDRQVLYEKVVVGAGTYGVKEFVEEMILSSAEENRSAIDKAIQRYIEQRISSAALLQEIISVLELPERALNNFKAIEICLDEPVVKVCKGPTCNSYAG